VSGLRVRGAAALLVPGLVAALCVPARAQPNAAALVEKKKNLLTFALTAGQIGDDFYLSAVASLDLALGPVGLGIYAPLNVLLCEPHLQPPAASAPPCGWGDARSKRAEKTHFGFLRKADWDEPDDFTSVIRYVRFGKERDLVYVLAGALTNVNVGHGTLVSRYANYISLDHPKLGLNFESNMDQGGTEVLIDAVALPRVFGGRLHVRPFNFGDWKGSPLGSIALGGTFMADRESPLAVKVVSDPDTGGLKLDIDDARNPVAERVDWFWGAGVDLEVTAVKTPVLDIIPYVDGNLLRDAGAGLHAGVLGAFTLGIGLELKLNAKLEYRIMQPGYLPGYFDAFYELQRWAYTVQTDAHPEGENMTKRAALQYLKNGSGLRQGYYGEAVADFGGLAQIGAIFEDLQGPLNATLGVYVNLPQIWIAQLEAYYWRKNFDGFEGIFGLDERSLLMARLRLTIWGPLAVRATYQRTWQADPATGEIAPLQKWDFGVEASFGF
jgi:hypothetical protein